MHITSQLSLNSSHGNDERPPDVLLTREILLRLPAESWARFRCVSKEWLSITTQPEWPYYCPYDESECSVMGDIPFLVAHLRDDHVVIMHSGSSFKYYYVHSNPLKAEHATWQLIAFQLGMAPVYIAFLRFMGDETEAPNYKYSLELVGDHGQKLIWEGTPRSIRDNQRKVRDSHHDGLIIQRNMALFFSGGDMKELKLRFIGRIWKDE